MRVLNLGSLNNDRVYSVAHIAAPGETIAATGYNTFCGGKGLNQSIAAARAGVPIAHAGRVGPDGKELLEILAQNGVDTRHIKQAAAPSGHAIIQVDSGGGNCIIVYSGANALVSHTYIDGVLAGYTAGDLLLLQNETSNTAYALQQAKQRGMVVLFNPSPITATLPGYPLHLVDHLVLNEVEAAALTDGGSYEAMLETLAARWPETAVVLTIGRHGVLYAKGAQRAAHDIYDVPVADTTAAGDTFFGYYAAGVYRGLPVEETLKTASAASSLAVSRQGAGVSIPGIGEVQAFLQNVPGTKGE